MRALLALALFPLATLPAQVFIVDAANGPGTHYTSLPVAVAAVPDGAVLSVRSGSYAGFTVNGKGLSILAETSATLTGAVAISNTQPRQSFALRGFTWSTGITASSLLSLTNCAGRVVLEALVTPHNDRTCVTTWCPLALWARGCSQLMLRSCTLGSRSNLDGCNVAILGSLLRDVDCLLCTVPAGPTEALSVNNSTVQIVDSSILGGNGGPYAPSVPPNGLGLSFAASDVRITRSTVASGTDPQTPQSAIYFLSLTQGSLRLDPSTVVRATNSPPIVGITPQVAPMPSVRATSARPGGAIRATVATEPGDLVVLVLGFPGPSTLVGGMVDAFWLNPVGHFFAVVGIQQSGSPIQYTVAVPNTARLLGLTVAWHAVAQGPATGLQNGNPEFSLVY